MTKELIKHSRCHGALRFRLLSKQNKFFFRSLCRLFCCKRLSVFEKIQKRLCNIKVPKSQNF